MLRQDDRRWNRVLRHRVRGCLGVFVLHLLQDFRGWGGQSVRCEGFDGFTVLAILCSKLGSSEVAGGNGG